VEGPDAALNSLAYVDIPSTVLDLPKNDVRPDILEEIARYVGKGIRTVQRRESELGFPLRRVKPGRKSIVLATPTGIEAWVQAQRFPDGQLNSVESEQTALFEL
jgi:hypothetical protein